VYLLPSEERGVRGRKPTRQALKRRFGQSEREVGGPAGRRRRRGRAIARWPSFAAHLVGSAIQLGDAHEVFFRATLGPDATASGSTRSSWTRFAPVPPCRPIPSSVAPDPQDLSVSCEPVNLRLRPFHSSSFPFLTTAEPARPTLQGKEE
jgi:hypothetical protein